MFPEKIKNTTNNFCIPTFFNYKDLTMCEPVVKICSEVGGQPQVAT